MGRRFSIDFTLLATYNEHNILRILEQGANFGFTYFDHILGERYEDAPVLTPNQALNKIRKAIEDKNEDGPTIYINLGDSNYSFLAFYNKEGLLDCHLFGMAPVNRKTFEEDIYEIDFEFYILLMLKLCNGFAIKQIELGEY